MDSSVLMREMRILYHCVAGVEPNSVPQSDSGFHQRLWRNQPSPSGIAKVAKVNTSLTSVSYFMSIDRTKKYLKLQGGWHRAQQPRVIGFRIGHLVVEESAIGFSDTQPPIHYCSLMNNPPL